MIPVDRRSDGLGQHDSVEEINATTGGEFERAADQLLESTYEEPMSLSAYVNKVLNNPGTAARSGRYLLDAIDHAGTRTVMERGETFTRYRFFDDPFNGGENAVIGNTSALNDFVNDLRSTVAGGRSAETIAWVQGPTATGKSELKRCLIAGLREYSKTEDGRRYTIEWNIESGGRSPGLTYGDRESVGSRQWHPSPVQTEPLSVFPAEVCAAIIAVAQESSNTDQQLAMPISLDPFSREAYDQLEERYRREHVTALFSSITDPNHLRVKNYVVGVGSGIGVLHAEDEGTPKERLVGSWMGSMIRALDSRGRKNPQAFSFDGILSQGNGLLTIVEDAAHHADLLQRLLNIPEEGHVKLDKGIGMDIDTQLIVISNPDLEAQLNQHADLGDNDPLRALKRRLNRYRFRYLVTLELEHRLLLRELKYDDGVPKSTPVSGDRTHRDAVTVRVGTTDGSATDREFAPHALEAAAMYAVVTRLDETDRPENISLVEKALLFNAGEFESDGTDLTVESLDFDASSSDGRQGIPVTYTRDVLSSVVTESGSRDHSTLPLADVIMPADVLDAMVDGLQGAPIFSPAERREFRDRVGTVADYVFEQQERDVLRAMMAEKHVDESVVSEYVEHVYRWATDDPPDSATDDPEAPDPLLMKVFEIEHLGRFDEDDYLDAKPREHVESFRRNRIITALNRQTWQRRDAEFSIESVDVMSIPVIAEQLTEYDWDDVARRFPDLEPEQWESPPTDTQTDTVKTDTIDRLASEFGYSPASATLTCRHVFREVNQPWE